MEKTGQVPRNFTRQPDKLQSAYLKEDTAITRNPKYYASGTKSK